MAAKTKACAGCRMGTDRPSGVCAFCAASRANRAKAREAGAELYRTQAEKRIEVVDKEEPDDGV